LVDHILPLGVLFSISYVELTFFISDITGEIGIGLEFKTVYGPTTIVFNPQETVEELVDACQRRLERLGL
jgi:hypothetical protein